MKKTKIFITGGVGDVLLMQCFYREPPTEIVWSTRARPDVQPIFEQLYPNCKHTNHWQSCKDDDDERYIRLRSNSLDEVPPKDAIDYGIFANFHLIVAGSLKYKGSGCLNNKIADVSRFELPQPYVLIQADTPFNSEQLRRERRLSQADWTVLINRLERENRYGVVVDCDRAEHPPKHERIIDLVGQTTLAESIELLKGAVGYYGLDSCIACLSCQRFTKENLWIKSVCNHYKAWRLCYCYPHKEFPFVVESFAAIKKPLPVINTRLSNEPCLVLLKLPRLLGNKVHNSGEIVEVPASLARILVGNGSAIDWISRIEQMRRTADEAMARQKEIECKRLTAENSDTSSPGNKTLEQEHRTRSVKRPKSGKRKEQSSVT